jgi:hypothetical protein
LDIILELLSQLLEKLKELFNPSLDYTLRYLLSTIALKGGVPCFLFRDSVKSANLKGLLFDECFGYSGKMLSIEANL